MNLTKIKARRMWGPTELLIGAVMCTSRALRRIYSKKGVTPYYVLPADADSIERMVEQMADGLCQEDFCDDDVTLEKFEAWRADAYRAQARAALAAIGIKGGAK